MVRSSVSSMGELLAILVILPSTHLAYALPTEEPTQDQDKEEVTGWSTEAILGLVCIFIAILCCAIGLGWSSHRRKLMLRRNRTTAGQSIFLPSAKAKLKRAVAQA